MFILLFNKKVNLMKKKFPEFYDIPDLEELWKNCHFIFDTNIFVFLYTKYTKEAYEDFLDVLEEKIPERIWMPYQVGLEYQRNRIDKIKYEEHNFEDLMGKIKGLKKIIKNEYRDQINQFQNKANFMDLNEEYMDLDLINKKFDEIDKLITDINEAIPKNIKFLDEDKIRNRLDVIFEDKVGENCEPSTLEKIHKEGKYRYANKIPPGFEDRDKKSGNPYGDLILWYQIMDYAKKKKVSIIFVTDDKKKDWWITHKVNNQKEVIWPNPHLIREFSSTGQKFYMYHFQDFLAETKRYLGSDVKDETIETVKIINELHDLEEEFEELERNEEKGLLALGSTLGFVPEYVMRQQEIINKIGYSSALESAVEVARKQQEIINKIGYSSALESAVEVARKQQEIINKINAPVLGFPIKKAKKKNKEDYQDEDTSEEE